MYWSCRKSKTKLLQRYSLFFVSDRKLDTDSIVMICFSSSDFELLTCFLLFIFFAQKVYQCCFENCLHSTFGCGQHSIWCHQFQCWVTTETKVKCIYGSLCYTANIKITKQKTLDLFYVNLNNSYVSKVRLLSKLEDGAAPLLPPVCLSLEVKWRGNWGDWFAIRQPGPDGVSPKLMRISPVGFYRISSVLACCRR